MDGSLNQNFESQESKEEKSKLEKWKILFQRLVLEIDRISDPKENNKVKNPIKFLEEIIEIFIILKTNVKKLPAKDQEEALKFIESYEKKIIKIHNDDLPRLRREKKEGLLLEESKEKVNKTLKMLTENIYLESKNLLNALDERLENPFITQVQDRDSFYEMVSILKKFEQLKVSIDNENSVLELLDIIKKITNLYNEFKAKNWDDSDVVEDYNAIEIFKQLSFFNNFVYEIGTKLRMEKKNYNKFTEKLELLELALKKFNDAINHAQYEIKKNY